MTRFLVFLILTGFLEAKENLYINPILPGSYPDPSICKVGDEFFIVNSSFEYFPGLPIHKSKDLINWELIGYGLHRKNQCDQKVNLVDVQSNGGIHAPTIRYHNGLFYIITTNVYYNEIEKTTDFVNFIITSENAAGPWSDPYVIDGAPGIDPDIFFDDDGKIWYVGTHSPKKPNFPGEGEIWLQELDIINWKLKGERYFLWRGACGGVWSEGPHMYKKDGRYYLMIAEGGTSFNHAIMVSVSENITGPFIPNERNPILSSRHLSYDNWVHSTGHGDLIELSDGRWYMVALGIRGDEQNSSNMGRETFLAPVKWEREPFEWKEIKYLWPVVAPKSGQIERVNKVPFENTKQYQSLNFSDDFNNNKLSLEWNFRRVPLPNSYSLKANTGHLRVYASPSVIKERGRSNFIGFRQKETDFSYVAKIDFQAKISETQGGIAIVQKDNNYITFTIKNTNLGLLLQINLSESNKDPIIVKETLLQDVISNIVLKIESKNHQYSFHYKQNDEVSIYFHKMKSSYILSKGYTGAYLGIYITSNGIPSNDYMDVDMVEYQSYQKLK